MGKRGPKPASALSIVKDENSAGIEVIERPGAPNDLTQEQAEIWNTVVDSLAADYFTQETFPILRQYCRHVSRAGHLAQLIDKMTGKRNLDKDDIKVYRDLLRSEEEQTRALASLATKMRLTHLATYNRKAAKARNDDDEPWND